MKNIIAITFVILANFCSLQSFAQVSSQGLSNHELIVIQKVDSRNKTFVIRKGMADQIYQGQKSLFSNKNISFVARAITVNREFSQWELIDEVASVPFRVGEIVNLSYSVEKIWTQIPRMISDKEYNSILENEKKLLLKKFGVYYSSTYQLLAGMGQGLSESTTESENNDGTRQGTSLKLKYTKSFNDFLRYEIGLRYDSDVITLNNPDLEITTQRAMMTLGLQARFNDFWQLDSIPYLSIAVGYGRSQGEINDSVKVGTANLLPSITVGIDIPINRKYSFLVEASVESISVTEAFADGVTQDTNATIAGVSLGLEFK